MDTQSDPIEIYRGNDEPLSVVIMDGTTPMNISGYSLWFNMKKDINDGDDLILITKTVTNHVDPLHGRSLITLTPDDTMLTPGNYVFEISLGIAPTMIKTFEIGIIRILPRVLKVNPSP